MRNDKYLLIKQNKNPFKGFWAPVHGKMEFNETEEGAIIREVQEEIGIPAKPIKKICSSAADYGVEQLHWWLVEAESNNIIIDTHEVAEYGFFSLADLLTLKLLPMAKEFFSSARFIDSLC
jgi:8-oxo-dGTP pyrophosphatase MutT (NUDIX family)